MPVVPRLLAYSMMKKCVSPRRDAPFQQLCCFVVCWGKHHFSKQAFRLGHIHVFKFMRCFAIAKQRINLKTYFTAFVPHCVFHEFRVADTNNKNLLFSRFPS